MREHTLSCKNIPAVDVLDTWHTWERAERRTRHPIELLTVHYGSRKLVLTKIDKLNRDGLLQWGKSPYGAWVTGPGLQLLREARVAS